MKTVYQAFPTITIPACLREWEDCSWKNDACARSFLRFSKGSGLVCWVDEEDPARREPMLSKDGRFVLIHADCLDAYPECNEIILYQGDSEQELASAVERAHVKYGIPEFFKKYGFEFWGTGGGCTGWRKVIDGLEVLVTDENGCGAINEKTCEEPVILGAVRESDGEPVGHVVDSWPAIRKLIETGDAVTKILANPYPF